MTKHYHSEHYWYIAVTAQGPSIFGDFAEPEVTVFISCNLSPVCLFVDREERGKEDLQSNSQDSNSMKFVIWVILPKYLFSR